MIKLRFPVCALAALGVLLMFTTVPVATTVGAEPAPFSTKEAAARLPPFKMSFSGVFVSGTSDEVRLSRIDVFGTRSGEQVIFECIHCRGVSILPTTARGRRLSIRLAHVIVTRRSRLVIDVTRRSTIGRYKEYKLDPQLNSHRLVHQGCLAIDVYQRINCAASGKVNLQIGPGSASSVPPSCPDAPCLALSRLTGFQVEVGQQYKVSTAPLTGRVIGWRIDLARPTSEQVAFFDNNEGGAPEAGIAVLRPVGASGYAFQLVAQSTPVQLQPFLGGTHEFALHPALRVERGEMIGLTVPTWAPALAVGFNPHEALWRASRRVDQCVTPAGQASVIQLGAVAEFPCLYEQAVLTFSATLSPDV